MNVNVQKMLADAIKSEVVEVVFSIDTDVNAKRLICSERNALRGLERLGFAITKGKKHYKMRWLDSGYFKTLSAFPSDFRTRVNGLAEMLLHSYERG